VPVDVAVVGGGIAGLSCAWRLHRRGIDVRLLEADDEPGGNVRTLVDRGFRVERGPHTFMGSAEDVFTLADEVGLAGEVVPTRPQASDRFIVRGGRLHAVPTGLASFVRSGLLSAGGKLRLAAEPFHLRRGVPTDTATRFFTRRFGAEGAAVLAGAFISGVYAGDPDKLSAPAAFPLFWGFEQEAGSMMRGALRHRRRQRRLAGSAPRRKGLFSFRHGLGQLTRTIAERLGDRCRCGAAVDEIVRVEDGFEVRSGPDRLRASRLVVAVPPPQASRLLRPISRTLGGLLGEVTLAPIAVVHRGYAARSAAVPEGFGYLAPRGEGVRGLGTLFASRLFDGRCPEGGELLTGFVGGMTDPRAIDRSDAELGSIVADDLRNLLGLDRSPIYERVARYPAAIPQLEVGHLERMERIESCLADLPGLRLAGNYLRGVGMKDAVASGFEAAAELVPPSVEECAT